jgi:hypothetical protein
VAEFVGFGCGLLVVRLSCRSTRVVACSMRVVVCRASCAVRVLGVRLWKGDTY